MHGSLNNSDIIKANRPNARWRKKIITPYVLVFPGLFLVLAILGYGVFMGIIMSLSEIDMMLDKTFIGFDNYRTIFRDPLFISSLKRTIVFVIGIITTGIVISMVFALCLNRLTGKRKRFFSSISLMPYFVSGIATTVMWRFMVSGNRGFVNLILEGIGIGARPWLSDPTLSFIVTIMASVWLITPFCTLILFSGLQTIDREMYEAASIDGASGIDVFWYITIPAIKPMIGISLIWLSYLAFSTFDVVLSLTGGGPFRATEFLAIRMYFTAFQDFDFGTSSAIMVILLTFNIVLSIIYLKIFKIESLN